MKFIGRLFSILLMVVGLGFIVIYFWSSIQSMVDTVWTEIIWMLLVGIASLGIGVLLAIFVFKRKPKVIKPKEPTKEEIEKAKLKELEEKANEGNPSNQVEYGRYFERLCQYEKALPWYQKAADQGYAEGELKVGFFYHNGRGVKQDYAKALEWYKKADEHGNLSATYNIGLINELGNIDKPHPKIAFSYYLKAAEQGHIGSMIKVGKAYIEGKGTAHNVYQGLKWLEDACEKGSGDAAYEISQYYFNLYHLDYNKNSARRYDGLKWRDKAANLGHAQSLYDIGTAYLNEGLYNSAKERLMEAANKGHKGAQEKLKEVNQKIAAKKAEERAEEARQRQAAASKSSGYSHKSSSSSHSSGSSHSSSSSSSSTPSGPAPERFFYLDHYEIESYQTNPSKHWMTGLIVYDLYYDVTFIYKNNKGTIWRIKKSGKRSNTDPNTRYTKYDLQDDRDLKSYLRSFMCRSSYESAQWQNESNIEKWL